MRGEARADIECSSAGSIKSHLSSSAGAPYRFPERELSHIKGAFPLKNQKHVGTGESTAALLDVWRLDRSPHFPVVTIRVKA